MIVYSQVSSLDSVWSLEEVRWDDFVCKNLSLMLHRAQKNWGGMVYGQGSLFVSVGSLEEVSWDDLKARAPL